jgi:hemerythrin
MTIEVNLANLIFILIALFSAAWGALKLLYHQFEKSQDTRFKGISDIFEKHQEAHFQLEREFLKLQSEIPRLYLRRDDHTRELQDLKETLQREMADIRVSVRRIEDFLIQK